MSRTAEYAVRAVVVLAHHFGRRPVSAHELASLLGAPRNYLSKTLNALARGGILTSARGPGGGFSLATPPDALTIGAVVDVFDGIGHGERWCLLRDAPCGPSNACTAHRRWSAITTASRDSLRLTAVSDLCGEPGPGPAAGRP